MVKAPLIPDCISCYHTPKRLWVPTWNSYAYSCSNETCANQFNKNWLIERQWLELNTCSRGDTLSCKTCGWFPQLKLLPKENIYLYSCSNPQCSDPQSQLELPQEIWQGMNIISLPCKHCGGVPERKWSLTLKCAVHRCSQERCTGRVVSSLYPHDAWYTLDLWTRQNLPTDAPAHNEKLHKLEDTKRACNDCGSCPLQNMCDYTSHTSAGDTPATQEQPPQVDNQMLELLSKEYAKLDCNNMILGVEPLEALVSLSQEEARFVIEFLKLPPETRAALLDMLKIKQEFKLDLEELINKYPMLSLQDIQDMVDTAY